MAEVKHISKFRFMKLWLADPRVAVAELRSVIAESGALKPEVIEAEAGDVILVENKKNAYLYLLLKGQISLMKTDSEGNKLSVTNILTGSLFGVLSFFSGKRALTSAIALSHCEILKLNRKQVDTLLTLDRGIADFGRQLIIANLLERYTQVVDLNMQLESLNVSLEEERAQLAVTLDELKATQKRLIAQEKMATLGQLVAGVAHEINNPAAALQSSVRNLSELFMTLSDDPGQTAMKFYTFGLQSTSGTHLLSTDDRFSARTKYPGLRQSELRMVLSMNDECAMMFEEYLNKHGLEKGQRVLRFYESGLLLKSISLSTDRISGLVRSLKSYSRQDQSEEEEINLADGLRDTLHILANRLKRIEVKLDIDHIQIKNVNPAELNQVWTNIIINACDAMNNQGKLLIECKVAGSKAEIRIHDSGHGVSDEIKDKIFEPNFTTRNSSGNFGLGLGLAISNDIIRKHGGKIKVENSVFNGALFRVILPLS